MSMHFRGSLLFFVNKGHGYYQGVPWVGNATRRPRIQLALGAATVSTKRWEGGGEATWKECFRFMVDLPGSALFTARTFLVNDDGSELQVTVFTMELATLLSHVGPQWHQFRSTVVQASNPSAIRAEILCEARWYPEGYALPPAFVRALSASADTTAGRPPQPAATPTAAAGSDHAADSNETSHLGIPIVTVSRSDSPHAPASPSLSPSVSTQRSTSLPTSSSSPTLAQLQSNPPALSEAEYKQSMERIVNVNVNVEHLSLFAASPSSSSSSSSSLSALESAPLPADLPTVFSSSLHGRLHPDTQSFDDRNFLEHAAALSSITELLIWGDTGIAALQLVYTVGGHRIAGTRHGQPNLSPAVLTLQPAEYITAIAGRSSEDGIKALTVVTNRQRRVYGSSDGLRAGLEMGEDFVCQAPKGSRVTCFYGGWNRKGINCIGICHCRHEAAAAALLAVPHKQKQQQQHDAVRGPLVKQTTARKI